MDRRLPKNSSTWLIKHCEQTEHSVKSTALVLRGYDENSTYSVGKLESQFLFHLFQSTILAGGGGLLLCFTHKNIFS